MRQKLSARTPRGSLSRERVVAAALALVDAEGLDGFNFRRISEELGSARMAPYSYFRNKEELVEAMLDSVFGRLTDEVDPSNEWTSELERAFTRLHDALDEHPGVTVLIHSRAEGDRLTELRDALLNITDAAGYSQAEGADLLRVLTSYVFGFVAIGRHRRQVTQQLGTAHTFEYGLSLLLRAARDES